MASAIADEAAIPAASAFEYLNMARAGLGTATVAAAGGFHQMAASEAALATTAAVVAIATAATGVARVVAAAAAWVVSAAAGAGFPFASSSSTVARSVEAARNTLLTIFVLLAGVAYQGATAQKDWSGYDIATFFKCLVIVTGGGAIGLSMLLTIADNPSIVQSVKPLLVVLSFLAMLAIAIFVSSGWAEAGAYLCLVVGSGITFVFCATGVLHRMVTYVCAFFLKSG